MKEYAIHWIMEGTTTVQASDEKHAVEIFNELPDIEDDGYEVDVHLIEEIVR